MADLLSIFAQAYPARSDSFITGAEGVQSMMNNALLYQQRREAMEAQRSLKDLYARNPQPAFEDLARIDPSFAMQQQLSNVELQGKMLGMQKTQGDIQQQQAKVFAEAGAPVAEKYAQAALSGQMTPELMSRFHSELGSVLADVEKQHGIRPPAGFNIEALDPIGVLQRSMNYYKSPTMENFMKLQSEQMMSGVPQRPSFGDVAGRTESGPYGPRYIPPVGMPGRGAGVTPFAPPTTQQEAYTTEGAMPSGMQPAPITNVAEDLAWLKSVRAQMPAGRQRDETDKLIADLEAGNVGQPSAASASAGGFVSPEQERAIKEQEERTKAQIQAESAGLRKTAETGAERLAEGQRITDAFKRAMGEGGVSRVMKLISESTSGPTETIAANIVSGIPRPGGSKSTSGMENIGALRTIAGELRKTIERSPGPQSDKDVALAALDAAGIADPNIPYNERMRGFLEFTRIIKERAETLGLDPKAIGIDVDVSTGAASAPQAQPSSSGRLRIGDVKNGYEYIGGNPNDQSSWRKSR